MINIWTALRFFFVLGCFSSFCYCYFLFFLVFLSQASHLSHQCLFLDFFIFIFILFLVPFKTFLVFSVHVLDETGCLPVSANHLSYRIVLAPVITVKCDQAEHFVD